jgi:hypothetical protein
MSVEKPIYVGKFKNVTHFEAVFFPVIGVITGGFVLIVWYLLVANRKRTEIRVFSDAVEIEATFIRKRLKRIESTKIESVAYNEGVVGKSKYGSVSISGTGMKVIPLTPVLNPEELAKSIRSIANNPKGSAPAGVSSNLVSAIEDLKRLHTMGVLSDEEFEKAKGKLL